MLFRSAGYTIAVRLLLISLLPSWGLCNAAATLVGQNLGAGRPDRAERAAWLSAFCNLGFMGCIGLFFILLANPLIQLFSQDPAVVQVGASCLRIISYGYALFGFGMVMIQALNGAGEVYTPLLMNVLGYWLIQLPLAYLLYGRLLALAEHIEGRALFLAGEKRETTAARLMQRFADRPNSAWRTIELSLVPYKTRLRNQRPGFLHAMEKEIDDVTAAFEQGGFTSDSALTGEFLLGYHCQRQALRPIDKATADDEPTQTPEATTRTTP